MQKRRKHLSQNFLRSRKLASRLVGRSSIVKADRILEIGPGKGIITSELIQHSGSVSVVEIDLDLISYLKKKFSDNSHLWIFNEDILKFPLPEGPYKVFSNLPYSIEGKIVRKLLDGSNPPQDSYLIVRKDLAERLSGIPHENQFSLKHKPWFEFSILHYLKGSDFVPVTKVDSVLWRVKLRPDPIIETKDKNVWLNLIDRGFGQGKNLRSNLVPLMGVESYKRMCGILRIEKDVFPSYVGFERWVGIYRYLKESPQLVESPKIC